MTREQAIESVVIRLRRLAASPYAGDTERRDTAVALLLEYIDHPVIEDAYWSAVRPGERTFQARAGQGEG
jgi:hypothetical protein